MENKPMIRTAQGKHLKVTIQYVFKASFNDTYWLEEKCISLDTLDREALTWFDPFNGRSKNNDIEVAVAYCSEDTLILLEKQNGVIRENKAKWPTECIICEDYDDSMLLAAHIGLSS